MFSGPKKIIYIDRKQQQQTVRFSISRVSIINDHSREHVELGVLPNGVVA